ncbi:MAG: metal-dependent transcriptional regulator [Chloroflexota bacterium]|jgi:DtxR family transcriptional regulator, Mn-dependent transcriptional regulator
MTNLAAPKFFTSDGEMTAVKPSPATQDYLRAIYKLSRLSDDGRVLTSELADALGVRPASVTAMLQKMAAAEPALVEYHKHHGARLSTAGETEALYLVRSHRLLELYLVEILGFDWADVHDEADRLEHVVSDSFIERLAQVLHHPTSDPHGHAIPAADLSVEPVAVQSLAQMTTGQSAVVQYIGDENPETLRLLGETEVRPGVTITLHLADLSGDLLWLSVAGEGETFSLDRATASEVFVRQNNQLET